MDRCIYAVACADDVVKRHLVGEDYQGACLLFRHSAAGLGDFVQRFVSARYARAAENPVDQCTALCVVDISVAEVYEDLSDFRLEYHDKREHSDVKNRLHESCHQPHVERRYQHPDDVERHDSYEDAYRRRSSEPLEGQEDDHAEKKYVQDVRKRHFQKSENRQ